MPSGSRVNSVLLATPYSTLHLIRRPRPGPLFDIPPSAFFLGYWFQARVRWFAEWPAFPVCFTPRGRREQIGTKSGFWALEGGLYCCHVLACWDVPELVFSFSWFDKVRELIYKDLCRFSFGGVFGSQNIAAKGHSTLWRCYWSLCGGHHFSSLSFCGWSMSATSNQRAEEEWDRTLTFVRMMSIMRFWMQL